MSNTAAKLAIVVVGLTPPYRGGIALHTSLLCQELARRHQLTCISYKRLYPRLLFPGKSQYDTSDTMVDVHGERLLDSLQPLTWFQTARSIQNRSPDLVIIQWWHPFFAVMLATVARRIKKKRRSFLNAITSNLTSLCQARLS